MKQLTLYNPRQPQPQQKLLKKYNSPQDDSGEAFYFVREGEHLLVYSEYLRTYPLTSPTRPGETKLLADQFEMPLPGIRWFITAIEQKFFKSPEDGGLPADKISYKEVVDGEALHIIRVVYAGCDYPGYKISNSNRHSYISSTSLQTLSLSDPWLFQGGLMDFLKETAVKYEAGQL